MPLSARSLDNEFWAVTCFFNPARYARRLENYRRFRERLAVPLVAVELSYDGEFELKESDAEILLQLRGEDVLWQKERLLNVALGALPSTCRKVAWLDCDLLFACDDWPQSASRLLDEFPLVQLFRRLHHLPRELADHNADCNVAAAGFVEYSIASVIAAGRFSNLSAEACLRQKTARGVENASPANAKGVAWAARRELLDAHGFYDGAIIGGGDNAMACAAYGHFDVTIERYNLNAKQREYYLAWAVPYYEAVRGKVSFVNSDLFHLWHGAMRDRHYQTRQQALERFQFDPFQDVAIAPGGCWRWNSDKPELHRYLKEYFAARREDG